MGCGVVCGWWDVCVLGVWLCGCVVVFVCVSVCVCLAVVKCWHCVFVCVCAYTRVGGHVAGGMCGCAHMVLLVCVWLVGFTRVVE